MAEWPYSTAAWQRLRRRKLSETPLCETCTARGELIIASHVDHIVSIKSGGDAFPTIDGLRSLCPPCHSIKTNALDRAGGKGGGVKGCDENGLPLDPDHAFYRAETVQDCAGIYPLEGRCAGMHGPAGATSKHLLRRPASSAESRAGFDDCAGVHGRVWGV